MISARHELSQLRFGDHLTIPFYYKNKTNFKDVDSFIFFHLKGFDQKRLQNIIITVFISK